MHAIFKGYVVDVKQVFQYESVERYAWIITQKCSQKSPHGIYILLNVLVKNYVFIYTDSFNILSKSKNYAFKIILEFFKWK